LRIIWRLLDYFKGKTYFVDGTSASGIGIIDYLFDHTDLKFLLIDEIGKLNKKDQKVLLNVMETRILSDVKAKSSKSARQTHMHLSVYATRFIKLNLPEYNLEIFTEVCQKLLSRKYGKNHETIQTIIQYVWERTRDVREAIAIAKIADTSDEVTNIASTLRRYSNEMRVNNRRRL
jgi:replication-associated recombination protein RarA